MIKPKCYVRATELIGFEEIVEGGEKQAKELLAMAGLDPESLSKPDSLISHHSFQLLHELAASELRRPSFGLEWTLATPEHFPNLGPIVMLSKLTSTLGEWATLALQYWRYHTNGYFFQLVSDREDGSAHLRRFDNSHAPAGRQIIEHTFANIAVLCRGLTSLYDYNPSLVRFQHSQPADISLHKQIFRCPLEFNAEHNEIIFPVDYLEKKTEGGLMLLKPIVGYYIRHRIRRLPIYDQSMGKTVELAVPSILGAGNCNVEFVSSSLGLSSKKLRRLLAAENTTFSDILDNVRHEMAKNMLAQTEVPVASIAGLLDYSSTPPFTLAFKRWTGQSPLEFRKAARSAS